MSESYENITLGEIQATRVTLVEDEFGLVTDETIEKPIRRFTWENSNNVTVQVITYGATITSIKLPDKDGVVEDVVIGFTDLTGYQSAANPYCGATVGRVANRIAFGKFDCLGATVEVSKNAGPHHLHGGFRGFDKVVWEPFLQDNKLILSYHSPDLEEGFPGDLITHIRFELTGTDELVIEFKATCTKPTYVNLTSHSYFNLAGHGKGPHELYKHLVSINANQIVDVDSDGIPTGQILSVAGTPFDLQQLTMLGDAIKRVPTDGFDYNYCISEAKKGAKRVKTHIARVYHPGSGRSMDIHSNQPGVQFYTANAFPDDQPLVGKGGIKYCKHGAFALETQNWPDAANHKNFPDPILRPGETYSHYLCYKFFVQSD